jgi:hypothetical protein
MTLKRRKIKFPVPVSAVVPAPAIVICPAIDMLTVGLPNALEMVPVVTTPCGLNKAELKFSCNLYDSTPFPVSVVFATIGILIKEFTVADVSLNCILIDVWLNTSI